MLPQHRDDVIATHMVLAIVGAPRRADANGKASAIPFGRMRFARRGCATNGRPLVSPSDFEHRPSPHGPPLRLEAFRDFFVVRTQSLDGDVLGGRSGPAGM